MITGFLAISGLAAGEVIFPAFAQESTEELIRRIDEKQRQIQTLTADFSQTRKTSLAKDPLTSSGTVKFKRPDRVYFQYVKPEPMEMALDGKTIWIYSPVRSQAEKYSLGRSKRMTSYLELVMGIFQKTFAQLVENYTISLEGRDKDRLYRFRLQPKEERVQKFLYRVNLLIDILSGAILRFEMVERGQDRLILEFKNLQLNPSLTEEDLEIKIPPSVRVLEQGAP